MNASLISAGTLDNSRTTAASANGDSTIIARDASGNFTANVGTFTTITGAGSGITTINASNISSGTVGTARLASGTANNTTFLRGDSTWATVSGGTVIPAGTVMIFGQTAAPTGFTKLTDQDNAGLRVVSGTASTGGSVNFTTAFASQAVSGSVSVSGGSVSNTTLGTGEIPSHTHGTRSRANNFGGNDFLVIGNGDGGGGTNSAATGGGGSHGHGFTAPTASFSGTAINLAVKYVDVIRATKD
jgi:hypothetical protein